MNPKANAAAVASFLHLSSNHSTHIHRLAAALVGYSTDFKYGKATGVLEHTMTSSEALTYIMNIMVEVSNSNITKEAKEAKFEDMIDTVMAQYTVIALSKSSDKQLIGWLKNNMPEDWNINTGLWVARYLAANIDLSTIKMLNGETLQSLVSTPEGMAFIKALNNKSAKTLTEITTNPGQARSNLNKSIDQATQKSGVNSGKDLNAEINEMIGLYKRDAIKELPVYSIRGNHDCYFDKDILLDLDKSDD